MDEWSHDMGERVNLSWLVLINFTFVWRLISVRGKGIQQRSRVPSGTASGFTVIVYLTRMRLGSAKWSGPEFLIMAGIFTISSVIAPLSPTLLTPALISRHALSIRKRLGPALWK